MVNIKLESADNYIIEADVEIVKCSKTIQTMLDSCGMVEEDVVVPLPNVNSATLRKILHWASFHHDRQFYSDDDDIEISVDPKVWDRDFLKVDQGTLFELMLAANYLDIKPLLDLTCKTVAKMIKGKTPAQIRKTFHIKGILPTDDETRIRSEDVWHDAN